MRRWLRRRGDRVEWSVVEGTCRGSWPMMMPATLWAMVAMGGVGGAGRSCAGQWRVVLLVVSWLLDWCCGTEC